MVFLALHINWPIYVQTGILHINPFYLNSYSEIAGVDIEIYSERVKRKIVECRECVLGMDYPAQLRARNLSLQDDYAPEDQIDIVILGESPPFRGGYIYDKHSRCSSKSFSYQVFADLHFIYAGMSSLSGIGKEMQLTRLGYARRALVLDCCNCAVNNLRGKMHDLERDKLVAACFLRFAEGALDRISRAYDPQIWFKLPPNRGNALWDDLRKKYGSRIVRKDYWSTLSVSSDDPGCLSD
jgi:hypothetical protein